MNAAARLLLAFFLVATALPAGAQSETGPAATERPAEAPSAPSPAEADTVAEPSEPGSEASAEAPADEPPLIPPELVKFVEADYPEQAVAERIETSVLLAIDIDATGMVEGVAVIEPADPPGYGFDEAAMKAANLFEFAPARVGEELVPVQITYRYNFALAPEPPPTELDAPVPVREPVLNFQGRLYERGNRTPLAGVIVTVFRGEGEAAEGFEATADEEGIFRLYDLPPGEWKVLGEPEGYYPLRTSEEIVEGERTEATYYVEKRSYNPFDVLVKATRPRKEVSRTSIDVVEADKVPGTFGDVLSVVQNLPGVARAGATAGNGALIVRGSAPEDSQVFINGVSVPLLYHFGGLRSVIPVGMLERLDFYPGNFSVEYGRATGGILDVGIKRLQPDGIHGYVDVNLFDAGFFVEVPVTESLSFAASARRSYIDFVLDAAVPDDASVNLLSAPRYYDYQFLTNWRPAPGHEVRAFVFGSDDSLRLLFANPGDAGTQLGTAGISAGTTFYRTLLEYRYVPNERFENVFRTSAGRNWIEFGAGDQFVFDLNFYVAQIRDTARYRFSDNVTVSAGVDYLFSKADAQFKLPLVAKEGERQDRPDLTNIFYSESEGQIDHSIGLFTELEWKLSERMLLVPGVRFDYFTRVGDYSIDPRVNARLELSERWVAKAGLGLFHQEPPFDETDSVFGNPDLGLESAVHVSAGAEYRPLDFLTIDATFFYKKLRNLVSRADGLVERDGEMVPQRYDNGGEGRVYGAEFLVRHEFANNFFGWVSYTLSQAERRDSGATDWRLFDFDQTHILAAIGSYRLPRNWEVGLRWRYVTGSLDTPVIGGTFDADADIYEPITGRSNSVRVAPFHQLDVRVDKRWIFDTWTFTAYLDIQNTYNRGNQEDLEYNYNYTESSTGSGLPILTVLGVRGEF